MVVAVLGEGRCRPAMLVQLDPPAVELHPVSKAATLHCVPARNAQLPQQTDVTANAAESSRLMQLFLLSDVTPWTLVKNCVRRKRKSAVDVAAARAQGPDRGGYDELDGDDQMSPYAQKGCDRNCHR